MTSQIPCPDCRTSISFDTQSLLHGEHFICGNCGVRIGLARESRAVVDSAIGQFDKLRHQVGSNR